MTTATFTFCCGESVITRWDTYRMDVAGADLSWLNSGRAPFLLDHEHAVSHQVGVIQRAYRDGNTLQAEVRFSERHRATEILKDVEDGVSVNVSVGFQVSSVLELLQPEPTGVQYVVTAWEPLEVSLVAVPADREARFHGIPRAGRTEPVVPARRLRQPAVSRGGDPTPGADRRSFYRACANGRAQRRARARATGSATGATRLQAACGTP